MSSAVKCLIVLAIVALLFITELIPLAIGASSHGLGTSACVNKSALQLAIGGVAIGLTGIATSILAQLLLPLLTNLF
jgi:putative effector of murein hydrolase